MKGDTANDNTNVDVADVAEDVDAASPPQRPARPRSRYRCGCVKETTTVMGIVVWNVDTTGSNMNLGLVVVVVMIIIILMMMMNDTNSRLLLLLLYAGVCRRRRRLCRG